jgi:Fe2+ or Zn2+ uptake regulation protein
VSTEQGQFGIIFCCDGCGDTIETRRSEFADALTEAKREGWKARKVCDEWMHFCKDCDE